MKEIKKVGYLYCQDITEDEIQNYMKNRFNGYLIKNMTEESYDRFRDNLSMINDCLGTDLENIVGFEEETLYFKLKKEIQLELLEAVRLNAIIRLSNFAVYLLDSDDEMVEE